MQLAAGADARSGSDTKARGGRKASKDAAPSGNAVHFETFETRAYDMSYACLLIPRNPEHLLDGKVAEFVQEAIRATCAAFGWKLTFVQVRPQYLQWVVSATVGMPPSKCIHTIREQSSKGILDKFKQFREDVKFQDFWAPGYLVLVSAEAHSQSIINEFITLTRQQQGLPPPGV